MAFGKAVSHNLCQNSEQIIINADIITLNPDIPTAEAIAISKERILALGTKQNILTECKGAQSELVDLNGATVLPGFIDTYGQFLLYGWLIEHAQDLSTTNAFSNKDWRSIKTIDDFLKEITLENSKPNQWIIVYGYNNSRMKGKPLTQTMLNELSATKPIIVFDAFATKAFINQAGIQKLLYEAKEENIIPPPDGIFKNEQLNRLLKYLITPYDARKALEKAAYIYARQGYTTVTETLSPNHWLQHYDQLTQTNQFPVDVVFTPGNLAEKKRFDVVYKNNRRFYAGPLLLRLDGLVQEYEAFLSEVYYRIPPHIDNQWAGQLDMQAYQLGRVLKQANDANIPVAIEAHGDAAIDFALKYIQDEQSYASKSMKKPVLVDLQYVRTEQLQRIKELSLKTNWSAAYLYFWGEFSCYQALGGKRAHQLTPLKELIERVNYPSIHAGTPASPPEPLTILRWLTIRNVQRWHYPPNRQCPEYFTIEKRIPYIEALKTMTINAAALYELQQEKGSLKVGALADMAILSGNPLKKPAEILTITGTIHRGKIMIW